MRSPLKIPCATPAWGAWSLWTMSHPSQKEKLHASPRRPPIIFEDNWMKELGSEVGGGCEDSQQTQSKIKNPIVELGQTCFQLCASVCDQDKDADENVDADQTKTERPVQSGQSIGLFTQREEMDIGFRVSGLPRAVVKQSYNPFKRRFESDDS